MGRRATETNNRKAHRLLSGLRADKLGKLPPSIDAIIRETIELQLPRKLSGDVLENILRSCPVISTRAAAEATGHRYARSTIAEYTMLARVASASIAGYLDAA